MGAEGQTGRTVASRRQAVRKVALLVLALMLLGVAGYLLSRSFGVLTDRRFNVVLLVLDAARQDRFDEDSELAPNFAGLARRGTLFRRAYTYAGSTAPSMAALFTGRFPYWPAEPPGGGWRWAPEQVFGLTRFFPEGELRPGIPDRVATLPEVLQRHGYATVGVATNPYLGRDFGFDRGFDFFEELSTTVPYAPAEDVAEKGLFYLSELRDQRFFLWLHFMDLHAPLLGYEPYLEEARLKRIEPQISPPSEWTATTRKHMTRLGKQMLSDWQPTEEGLARAMDHYALAYDAEVLRLDRQIGRIVDALDQWELRDRTLVIVVNDHGDEFTEHGAWSHEGQLYEPIVRGIWIMSNPRLVKAQRIDQPVSQVDLLPTLIELLDLPGEEPASLNGVSRLTLLRGRKAREDQLVFGLLDRRAFVIEGRHKLLLNFDFGKVIGGAAPSEPPAPRELYDLETDPGETQNVVQYFPRVADRLELRLRLALKKQGIDYLPVAETSEGIREETLQRLRALGYVH